jgi:tRNA 2-thiouridine synthesizing protein A
VTERKVDLEVDALGLLCPLPVLRLKKRMRDLGDGAVIRLLADDPAAHVDVPHFCAEAGHGFEGVEGHAFLVRKGAAAQGGRDAG